MPTYEAEVLTQKKYAGNVVILLAGKYFAIRPPDSGLTIPFPYSYAVSSLVLNPTTINPRQVTSSISSTSFSLIDKKGIVSAIVKDTGDDVINTDVEIYLGRTGVGMAFADYKKLPTTRISKSKKSGGLYNFTTRDTTERIARPIFTKVNKLNGDILAGTTSIVAKTSLADWPASGMFRIDSELITYSGISTNTFTGCARGAVGTTPADHAISKDITLADTVTDNPLNIILKLLISNGGGGTYDTLTDGLGISPTLIDVAAIESLRDDLFATTPDFTLTFYGVASALKTIEKELLMPCNLRFSSAGEKLSLAILDRAQFVEQVDVLDHDTITATPTSDISADDIQNKIIVSWDYDEDTGQFQNRTEYTDDASIALYGNSSSPLSFEFKGVDDQAFVDDFAERLLDRFSTPTPTVTVKTQMDKSLLNVGDKSVVETSLLPNSNGALNFADTMEIVSRAINWQNGEVTLKLAYTSFSGYRLGYIAPSDLIASITSQSVVELAAGRGDFWSAGWKIRLWNNTSKSFEPDGVNEIASIDGDEITFVDPWTTTLTTAHMLRLAAYDQAVAGQRRYAFISPTGSDFSQNDKEYSIVP